MKVLTAKARKESFVHQGAIGGTLPLVFYNHIAHNFPEVRFTFLSALPNFNDGAGDTKQWSW